MCFSVNSAIRVESVGCNLMQFETKNVKKKGRPSSSSTVASPPTITDLPSETRRVTALIGFTGITSRSSSGVRREVSCPRFINPGVSTTVTPLGSLILIKSSVVPGRLETVACGTYEGQHVKTMELSNNSNFCAHEFLNYYIFAEFLLILAPFAWNIWTVFIFQ